MTNTKLCKTEGCDKIVKARGFCSACYYRNLRHGKLEIGAESGCWKHRISNIDIENKIGDCSTCGRVKIIRRGKKSSNWRCSVPANSNSKERKRVVRQLKKDQLIDHCEICESTSNLCWDHNHKTGNFRGTLCKSCNSAIGLLKDSSDICLKAAKYLNEKASSSL